MSPSAPPADRPVFTGLGVLSAFGAGLAPLTAAAARAETGFAEVTRFDVGRRGTRRAALLPDPPPLAGAVLGAVADACEQSELPFGAPLLLALHSDLRTREVAEEVSKGSVALGLAGVTRVYTGACVAAATAVADAAALVVSGRYPRVVVAAGHLVEPGVFAAFDAGRALARDGQLRPFSTGRSGTLLGDAAAAVVVEADTAAAARGVRPLARLAGWGRSGDAHHVCRPRPDGAGVVRAVRAALARAAVAPSEVGYVNANGTGSPMSDLAEARALREVFGRALGTLPVSSSKSVHGHALEASALLELAVTIGALDSGRLPVNAGWLGPDPELGLNLVLNPREDVRPRCALSLNSAFGGANTALLVAAA